MATKEAPPSYESAASEGSSSNGQRRPARQESIIPPQVRRSMEDINRPLPRGWVRQWDPKSQHNFYVDTKAKPPRSLWSHPLDDEQYRSENPEEAKELSARQYQMPHHEAFNPDFSSDDDNSQNQHHPSSAAASKAPPKGMKKLGQSMKNKMTGTTHEQRVAQRKIQREKEEKAYRQHQAMRAAMVRASQTGEPQLIGKDQQGREIYAQPPPVNAPHMGSNVGYGPYQTAPQYPYGGGAYAAPYGPYQRRPGYGYGGGMGMPIMGGMMGGMLLGGLLF